MTNLETEPAPLPPPSPATPPPEHRWARSDDRIVLGVAGGLGRALAIEPFVVRLVFVVLGLFSGVGVLLYAAGLALLADSPTSPPPSTARRIGGGVVVLICARWLFGGDAHLPDAGWVVAIGLLGAAVALWRGRTPAELRSAPPVVEAQPDADGGSTTDRWTSLKTYRRERPRPPRSALGLLTIGAATVVGALIWLIGDGVDDRGALAFGWATVVLGAGLLVGTFAGRARWLFVPAVATSIAAVAASALSFAGVGLDHRWDDRTEYVGVGNTVAPVYRTGIGSFDLILADYPSDASTEIHVGIGDLTVVVPEDAHVQVDARVGVGEINVFGATRDGYRRSLSIDNNTDGARMIKLKLRVGVGSIDVRRGIVFDGIPVMTAPLIRPDLLAVQFFGDGTVLYEDGTIDFSDGWRIEANGMYQIPIVAQNPDGSVQLENGAIVFEDGTVVTPGGFEIPRSSDAPSPTTTIGPSTTLGAVVSTAVFTTTTEVQP